MFDISSKDQAYRLYETLFSDSPDAIALCDMQQVVVKINPAFTALFGFTANDAVGRPLEELITPTEELRCESDRLTSRILHKKKVFTQSTRARKDGTTVPVSIMGLTYRLPGGESLMFWDYRDISPLIDAKRKAAEVERKFRTIFHNAPYPIFVLDKDSLLSYTNPAMDHLFDLPGYKLIGLPLNEITGPEEREEAILKFRECEKGHIVSIEFNYTDGVGTPKRGIVRGFPIKNEKGQFDGVVSFLEDVTDRRNAENRLLQEENKYQTVFENDPIPKALLDLSLLKTYVDQLKTMGISDFDAYSRENADFLERCYRLTRIIDVNEAAIELFSVPNKEYLLVPVADLPLRNRLRPNMIGIVNAIAGGVRKIAYQDVKYPYPDEAKPLFFLNTWTVAKGFEKDYSHVYLTMLDITEIKASQVQAVESERQYRMLLENAQEGILGVDAEARFTFANPQLENMLGYPERELVGLCLFDLIVPPDSEAARRSFERGKQGHADKIEIRLLNRDGTSIPTLIKATPVFDGDGKFVAGVGLVDDLRRIRSIEDELREQTKRLGTVWHQTIAAIAYAVESRDPYTAGHQRRVQQLAMAIAEEMNLSEQKLSGLKIAALVHDIGKISIPSEILSKPGHLSHLEYRLITNHSKAGYDILSPIEFPWPIAEIVYQHHEAIDGSGYPRGLKGEEILLEARILAVADMVEAVSSHRPYRAAFGTQYALQELDKDRGLKYDPEVVEACVQIFSKGFAWKED